MYLVEVVVVREEGWLGYWKVKAGEGAVSAIVENLMMERPIVGGDSGRSLLNLL